MSKSALPSVIRNVPTGIPGLDTVLGGGLCEYSFNLIAGAPGAGKTTLVQQVLFANATKAKRALYFTVLGEPTVKMMRYQQQFAFFDPAKIPSAIRFINLSKEAISKDLDAMLTRIVAEVTEAEPTFVAVDSFRTIGAHIESGDEKGIVELAEFVQRLAQQLTSWEITSFLLGEYTEQERRHPVFTVADSILWLSDDVDRNSAVRKLRAVKVRGRAPMPGLHTFRITSNGMEVFPRIPEQQRERVVRSTRRLLTGVPGLDDMMNGGVPEGDVLLLTGPAGSGKTTFATQFVSQGLKEGESCVVAVFEEFPEAYLARAKTLPIDFGEMISADRLAVIYLRPLDLSVDEMLAEIMTAVRRTGATRVVIDSLSGFEIALAPTFRIDFRESLYRLVGALTATGVTILMTAEVVEAFADGRFTSERVSFVTDDIIVQRYVEIGGHLKTVLAVVKMRGSDHATDFRLYDLTARGAVMGESLVGYHGITTGVPTIEGEQRSAHPAITETEAILLGALVQAKRASAARLTKQSGLSAKGVRSGIARLLALGYIEKDKTKNSYRAVALPDGG
ncbi:MAG: AAA family ATPase [Gemmatimonadota bacterium]|nr:AAA family ATPase [Gemmatimonadota bacterium]